MLRNLANHRRFIFFPVSRWIVGFSFAQDVVHGREEPSGNGNDGFLLAAPLLEGLLLPVDFGMLFAAAGSKRNLNQQRLEVSAGFANTSGFLLACHVQSEQGR